jgi:hypothetical protein
MPVWLHFFVFQDMTINTKAILDGKETDFRHIIDISKLKKHFCIQDGHLSFSECVIGYFEWKMKCKLPWNSKSSIWNLTCSTVDHLKQFIDLSENLGKKTTSEIFNLTNCYRECESYSFQVTQKFDQIIDNG